MNKTLRGTVQRLLSKGKEGEYWDFKQEWYEKEKKADLIKDIICFSNTPHDKDCYIIFGVDDNCNVVGMKEIEKRRKQADILDTLSNIHFAGDNVPKISVESIEVQRVELDVLIVENMEKTPVYLKQPYPNKKGEKHKIEQGCIYTRTGDKNTPNGANADIQDIEKLWKKRLGLLKAPLEYIYDRLQYREEWNKQDSEAGSYYYNIYRPELVLDRTLGKYDPNEHQCYSYVMINPDTFFSMLKVKCQGTVLTKYEFVGLDGDRYSTPVPEWRFKCVSEDGLEASFDYRYFIFDSNLYRLHLFFYDETNHQARAARDKFMEVVLVYDSVQEKDEFEKYVKRNYSAIEDGIASSNYYATIGTGDKSLNELYKERLRTGYVLNKWLEKFRKGQ
ncbi:ATP-binding protein [Bacillus sp. FSL W7-1360]